MAGNKKHGYLRGNNGGFKPQSWFCNGCQRLHPGKTPRNGTLDGRSLCDRLYNQELKRRMAQP